MDVSFLTSVFSIKQYPPEDRPEIAFAGRSNVGKSSLINTLTNRRKLAKTSSRPGRTQSLNFFDIHNMLYLVDLPGYGFARVPLEVKKAWRSMVETYLRRRANLKAVVVILDIRRDLNQGDLDLLEWLKYYGINDLVVLTKADKLSRQQARRHALQLETQLKAYAQNKPILFSAKTRQGRDEVWERICSLTGCYPPGAYKKKEDKKISEA